MNTVNIGGCFVGDGHRCFIVAEAGSNHNGKLEEAKALVRLAADAGADAVKFQTFRAEHLYTRNAGKSDYLRLDRSIYDVIAAMEMPYEWLPILAEEATRNGLLFLSTPFDERSADELDRYVPAFKIASYDITNLPLLRYIAKKGKPLVISTGTANLDEVRETVEWVKAAGTDQLILLQCTASYPTPIEALNLRAMLTMRREFDVPVGLSDHSRDPIVAPVAAVAMGACFLEKHFTFSNELPGPDHRFAIEPPELRQMIARIRACESALGSGDKTTADVEQELREFARRTIFTSQDIAEGEIFTRDNVAVLRAGKAGHGLPPAALDTLLGKRARRHLAAELPITPGDFE